MNSKIVFRYKFDLKLKVIFGGFLDTSDLSNFKKKFIFYSNRILLFKIDNLFRQNNMIMILDLESCLTLRNQFKMREINRVI